MYIFHLKNMVHYPEKYANIRGKSGKTRGKGKFSLFLGEKYHLGKKVAGQKYHILQICTPELITGTLENPEGLDWV